MSIEEIYQHFKASTGVTTDTRKIESGTIFFALKGANFNGNTFAQKAIELGASLAIVDEEEYADGEKAILVDSVLETLQALGRHHRRQFTIPFIGITGTNGKTTTKECIYHVLKEKFRTHATAGNFNNHIGVPLTLLGIPQDTEIAIIEMGANHPGEIGELSAIAEPDYGIITNVGKAHLEGFGGFEGVKRTKKELYDWVRANGKMVFANADDDFLMESCKGIEQRNYSMETASKVKGKIHNAFPTLSVEIEGWDTPVQTHLAGAYNLPNILAAICIGDYFGMTHEEITAGLDAYQPSANRSQWTEYKGAKVLLDAYNANPTSLKAAIENFHLLPHDDKALILGDMFELGEDSLDEHKAIIELLQSLEMDKSTILVGKHFEAAIIDLKLEGIQQHYDNSTELKEWFSQQSHSDKCYLIKGSRGIALEKILE